VSEPAPKSAQQTLAKPASEADMDEPAQVQRLRRVGGAEKRPAQRVWAQRLRRAAMLLIALAVVLTIVKAWMPAPLAVEMVEAKRGPMLVTVDEEGRTRVKDRYVVSAPLMGNLARIELRPGDTVEPGTVVARIVPLAPPLLDARTRAEAEARVAAASAARKQSYAAIERARTGLEFADKEAARARGLTSSGAVAASALERAELEARTMRENLASAEFGARVADHDLQMAQAVLGRLGNSQAQDDQLELTASVRGRVLRVIQQSEGVVQPGTPLLEIGDPGALEIVVAVLTSDAVHIEPRARVQIERWGGDKPLAAHVRLVEPSADTRISALGVEEQRVNVLVDLDAPRSEWARLGDGYRVEARIAVWESKDTLSVPASAVFRRAGSWAVFKVDDGVARVVSIEVGERNPEQVQVTSGLKAGDRVVGHPSERLTDGMTVEPL
jgi:HlyD family secretion protein